MRTIVRRRVVTPTRGGSARVVVPLWTHRKTASWARCSPPQHRCSCRRHLSSQPTASPPPFELSAAPRPTPATAPRAAAAAAKWREIDSAAATLTVRALTLRYLVSTSSLLQKSTIVSEESRGVVLRQRKVIDCVRR